MVNLKICGCDPGDYIRLTRPFWLRALTDRRFYRCPSCGAKSLIDKAIVYQHADSKWNLPNQPADGPKVSPSVRTVVASTDQEPGGIQGFEGAKYSKSLRRRAVSRSLPPHRVELKLGSREAGVDEDPLERLQDDEQSSPASGRKLTAEARLEAVITTAALHETARSEWCRLYGVSPVDLAKWRANCTAALASPEEGVPVADSKSSQQDRLRIKELERNLLRKDRALAEAAVLLVLSKRGEALYSGGEDE